MMKKIFNIILILTTFSGIVAQTKVGTTAANFLTIPVGPRATAMGGAFSAVANDATSSYWNAAGLSRLAKTEFSVTTAEWLVGTRINWVGLAYKLDDDNAFGISINQLDYGEEDITTPEQPQGTGAKWSANDLAVSLSYARNLTDRFSIGGSVKYITQKIWNESASAFALDIGLLFQTEIEGLKLGANISNFGTEMKLDGKDLKRPIDVDPSNSGNNPNISGSLDTDSWPLPLVFTVGLSYNIMALEQWKMILTSDAVIPNNQSTYGNFGFEIDWNSMLFLRAGYNGLLKEKNDKLFSNKAMDGFSAGIGLQYDFGDFFTKFDYSYSNLGIFNQISRFSLTIGL
jgi:hypothetical protein